MKYFLSFFLIVFGSFLFAQKVSNENIGGMKSNVLNVSGTIEGELWFFYERIFKKQNAFEFGYGKKWDSPDESSLSEETDQARFYGGNIFMGSYKRYFNFYPSNNPFYLSILGFSKNYYFDNIKIIHITSLNQNCQIRSSNKQVYGFKLLFGRRFNFDLGTKVALVMDIYSGIGIRKRIFNDLVYASGETYSNASNCNCNPYPKPITDNSSETTPSIHLGVKFGVSF